MNMNIALVAFVFLCLIVLFKADQGEKEEAVFYPITIGSVWFFFLLHSNGMF